MRSYGVAIREMAWLAMETTKKIQKNRKNDCAEQVVWVLGSPEDLEAGVK
ncbi:MAG: hypothetical protein GY818_23550 [Planctomycetaceae bacterium]|nr:hypothetical protein [Planctomycetaceae bacterium]